MWEKNRLGLNYRTIVISSNGMEFQAFLGSLSLFSFQAKLFFAFQFNAGLLRKGICANRSFYSFLYTFAEVGTVANV